MAIEIIPKKETQIPHWQNILLYFGIFLLIGLIIGYFTLNYFIEKSERKLQQTNEAITKAKSPERIILEEELKSLRAKIEDFTPLLLNHQKSSNFFDFLEKNTHPKVFFTKLDLDTEGNHVGLSGQTDDFQILGQQLLIFQKTEFLQGLKLSKVEINKEGKVEFTFDLSLNPKLFTQ
jgi:Tfp pilus assembly protein PilN